MLLKWTHKKWPQTLKNSPKWKNFAQSGYTGCKRECFQNWIETFLSQVQNEEMLKRRKNFLNKTVTAPGSSPEHMVLSIYVDLCLVEKT